MSMTLDENTLGIWSVHLGAGNWLAQLAREGDKLVLTYRFRWYRDDRVYDSQDNKSWFRAETKSLDIGRGVEAARRLYGEILQANPTNKGWELLRGERSVDEFFDKLFTMPGMHHKVLDAQGNEVPEQ